MLRLLLALLMGILVGAVAPTTLSVSTRSIIGWCVFCLVNVAIIARLWWSTPEQIKAWGERDDESRNWSGVVTSLAAVVSLVGVLSAMVEAHTSSPPNLLLVMLGVVTVVLSWLLVHLEYALHYADQFHTDGAVGFIFRDNGVDAKTTDPDFRDFAYVAFTIGMSFAISDTDLNTRAMRRRVLGHALLSYLFGSAIVAVTINAVASFLG